MIDFFEPSQCSIESAILQSISINATIDQTIDIAPLITMFEFTESIFNNTIHGKVVFTDGVGLLNNTKFTITGEEFLTIKIVSSENINFTYKFVVSNIDVEVKTNSGDSAVVALQLISIDAFSNTFTFKSKGYLNQTIDTTVKEILTKELLSEVPLVNFLETTGNRTYGFTRIRPFEKINMVASQAFEKNTSTLSSTYFFYENREGYNFRSIENIIFESRANNEPLTYAYSQLTNRNFFVESTISRPIKSVVPTTRMTNLDRLASGFYGSDVIRFDFLQKRITSESYTSANDIKNFQHVIGDQNDTSKYTINVSEAFASKVSKASNFAYFIPWSSDEGDLTYKSLLYSVPYLTLLRENTLEIVVDGTLRLQIGDPLDVLITDNRPTVDVGKDTDSRYSGRYVIQSINHLLTVNDFGSFVYNNSLSITRDLIPISQSIINQQTPGGIDIPVLRGIP